MFQTASNFVGLNFLIHLHFLYNCFIRNYFVSCAVSYWKGFSPHKK
ncbi:hypothetical protein NEIELOOT_02211 [Neisseria elongata subsp. glycolytica ATCC 29315]|uniref:Uncharacterized protein n=1 Tax=Neisseria elongata subsp. glycolytica ATCC 29315 TaxID=546263 RepID=D4DT13_NEIEG|nr:hypothetical protein NEIELOOT_02211 [Neisseria elongata subsp. glycolytica ATCC 29315]